MRRALLNIAVLLSLVVFAAICLAWLSMKLEAGRYELYHYGDSRYLNLGWSPSGVYALTATYPPGQIPIDQTVIVDSRLIEAGYRRGVRSDWHRVSSAQWQFQMNSLLPHVVRTAGWGPDGLYGGNVRVLEVSFWALALASAMLPLWRVLVWRHRRQRSLAGHCPRCGYDLRATPDRCPECGKAPVGPAAA